MSIIRSSINPATLPPTPHEELLEEDPPLPTPTEAVVAGEAPLVPPVLPAVTVIW